MMISLGLGPDKASIYANAANLGAIALVLLFGLFFLVVLPKQWRAPVGALVSAAWLPMNLFTDFPALFVPAKVTFLAGPMLILAGLYSVAPWSLQRWTSVILPLWGLWGAFYVIRTEDVTYAITVRVGWAIGAYAFSALAVYMVETKQYREVMLSVLLGMLIPIALAASALALSPNAGFGRGVGRFFPWGANPNQIGPLFASASVLALMFVLIEPRLLRKQLFGACLVFCAVLTLMTGSRSALMIIVVPSLMVAIGYRKFTIAIGILMVGFLVVLITIYQSGATVDLSRITSGDDSGRFQIATIYFQELIEQRPLVGLLREGGLNSQQQSGVGTHSPQCLRRIDVYWGLAFFIDFFRISGLGIVFVFSHLAFWGASAGSGFADTRIDSDRDVVS